MAQSQEKELSRGLHSIHCFSLQNEIKISELDKNMYFHKLNNQMKVQA